MAAVEREILNQEGYCPLSDVIYRDEHGRLNRIKPHKVRFAVATNGTLFVVCPMHNGARAFIGGFAWAKMVFAASKVVEVINGKKTTRGRTK